MCCCARSCCYITMPHRKGAKYLAEPRKHSPNSYTMAKGTATTQRQRLSMFVGGFVSVDIIYIWCGFELGASRNATSLGASRKWQNKPAFWRSQHLVLCLTFSNPPKSISSLLPIHCDAHRTHTHTGSQANTELKRVCHF